MASKSSTDRDAALSAEMRVKFDTQELAEFFDRFTPLDAESLFEDFVDEMNETDLDF